MKKKLTIFLVVFIAIEFAIAMAMSKSGGLADQILSVSSIVVAFIGCIILFRKTKVNVITLIALLFTLIADVFLSKLFLLPKGFESNQIISMFAFSVVQICYVARLVLEQKNTKGIVIHLVIRAILVAIALVITYLIVGNNLLALISLFYFTNLFINVVVAFIQFKKAPVFAIGLLFFALCDLLIGFSLIGGFITIPEGSIIHMINSIPGNVCWYFYLPSQTMIVCDLAIKTYKN